MRRVHWLGALCLSLLLHVGVAGVIPQPQSIEGEARDDGEGGVEIGLGLAGTYSEAAPPSDVPAKQPKAPAPPQPASEPSQGKINKPSTVKVEKAAHVPARLPEPRIKPEEAKAATVATPGQTQIAPERAVESATGTTSADTTGAPPQTTAPQQGARPPQQKATGSGTSNSAGGRKGTAKSYFGDLMAWLNKHKRYPPELKKRKKQGIVTLRFTIDGTGRVLSSRIEKTSGTEQLDQAALSMLAAASPLPPIPEEMKRDTLSLVIPVEYSLITNRFD